jgi:tetratricopeptide (TPR) repeat protein
MHMFKTCLLVAAFVSVLSAQTDPDEKSLKEALEKAKASPAETPQFAKGYRDLAEFYCAQSRYGDAEPLIAKLLEEHEHAFGLNSAEIVQDISELARVNFAQMKFGAADTHWRRALQIVEQTGGKQSKDLAPLLENLARAALAQDKAEEGSKYLRRALAIREKSTEQRASDLLVLASTLNLLGRSYMAESKEVEAEASFVRALRTVEKAGGNALELSSTLDNLGSFYLTRQKYEQAEPALRRALAVRESSLGPVDPAIAPVLDQLGAAYNAQKKYPEAAKAYERALFIRMKSSSAEHPLTRMNVEKVAEVYAAQGKDTEAEPLYRQLLSAQEGETVTSLVGLARLLASKERTIEAENLFKTSISILDKGGWTTAKRPVINPADPPPPILIEVLDDYASVLKKMKKKGDAAKMEARARLLSGRADDSPASKKSGKN